MSGNEYYPTRPHAPQDARRIAAGSPLAILGLLLEGLRERFGPENGTGTEWRDDVQTTDIIIETGYNVETESRNAARALYVNRLSSVPQNVVMNNHAGTHLPSGMEGFLCMMTSQITVDCVSNDAGDSALLGDIVQHFLIGSRKIFEGWYGIHDFSLAEMGQTQPFDHDQAKWATTVAVTVMYQIRWSAQKIRPLLQDIGITSQDASAVAASHIGLAVSSLQRSTSSVTTAVPASLGARTGYTHVQTDLALVWEIAHGLGVYPAITIVNASGRDVTTSAAVQHTTTNTTRVTFATPTAGTARCL